MVSSGAQVHFLSFAATLSVFVFVLMVTKRLPGIQVFHIDIDNTMFRDTLLLGVSE